MCALQLCLWRWIGDGWQLRPWMCTKGTSEKPSVDDFAAHDSSAYTAVSICGKGWQARTRNASTSAAWSCLGVRLLDSGMSIMQAAM